MGQDEIQEDTTSMEEKLEAFTPSTREWEKMKCPQCGLFFDSCVELKAYISNLVATTRREEREILERYGVKGIGHAMAQRNQDASLTEPNKK